MNIINNNPIPWSGCLYVLEVYWYIWLNHRYEICVNHRVVTMRSFNHDNEWSPMVAFQYKYIFLVIHLSAPLYENRDRRKALGIYISYIFFNANISWMYEWYIVCDIPDVPIVKRDVCMPLCLVMFPYGDTGLCCCWALCTFRPMITIFLSLG